MKQSQPKIDQMFFDYGGADSDEIGPLNLSELHSYTRQRESALSGSLSRMEFTSSKQQRQSSMMHSSAYGDNQQLVNSPVPLSKQRMQGADRFLPSLSSQLQEKHPHSSMILAAQSDDNYEDLHMLEDTFVNGGDQVEPRKPGQGCVLDAGEVDIFESEEDESEGSDSQQDDEVDIGTPIQGEVKRGTHQLIQGSRKLSRDQVLVLGVTNEGQQFLHGNRGKHYQGHSDPQHQFDNLQPYFAVSKKDLKKKINAIKKQLVKRRQILNKLENVQNSQGQNNPSTAQELQQAYIKNHQLTMQQMQRMMLEESISEADVTQNQTDQKIFMVRRMKKRKKKGKMAFIQHFDPACYLSTPNHGQANPQPQVAGSYESTLKSFIQQGQNTNYIQLQLLGNTSVKRKPAKAVFLEPKQPRPVPSTVRKATGILPKLQDGGGAYNTRINLATLKNMMDQAKGVDQSYDPQKFFKYSSNLDNNPLISKIQNRGLQNQVVKSLNNPQVADHDEYQSSLVALEQARNNVYSSPQEINLSGLIRSEVLDKSMSQQNSKTGLGTRASGIAPSLKKDTMLSINRINPLRPLQKLGDETRGNVNLSNL